VLAVLCAGLLVPACARKSGDEEIESAEVPTIAAEVGTVERRDLVEPLLVRGSVVAAPNEDVKLAAQVPGRVVALRLAEGDQQLGATGRVTVGIGMVGVYARYAHFWDVMKDDNVIQLGLVVKLPLWTSGGMQ
jgi:hypothetical protein